MTLIELLWTLGILAFVMSGIIAVFVSGLHSEFDMNQRFEAQQEARLALQSIRTDLRSACTAKVSSSSPLSLNDTVLLGFCSDATHTWSLNPVAYTTWCARSEGGTPTHYGLVRESGANDPGGCATTSTTGIREADWLTTHSVFTCFQSTARPELGVNVPVDTNPANGTGLYKLSDTILLRNAGVGGACT